MLFIWDLKKGRPFFLYSHSPNRAIMVNYAMKERCWWYHHQQNRFLTRASLYNYTPLQLKGLCELINLYIISLSLRNPNLYKDIRCWVYRPCHSCYTNWLFNWNYLHACLWIFWKLNLWNVVWKEIFCLISGPGVCYPNTAHRNSSPGRKDYTQLQGKMVNFIWSQLSILCPDW